MRLEHVGIEVRDLFRMELFYRKVLGFELLYRYVSRNTPGLRTVFLRRQGTSLELLSRLRAPASAVPAAPFYHLAFEVEDVDAAYAGLAALGLPALELRPPRLTGDGYRELELRDPEGNVIELSRRVAPPPAPPVRAVIFDVDGTLLDSEENYFLADEELLRRRGIPFTRLDKQRYIGGGNRDMMQDLKRRFALAESAEELADEKNALYLELAAARTQVYPEMKRFLLRVRERGLPAAAASGSARSVLERLLGEGGLAEHLDAIVTAEDVALGKPAPDVFLEAARRLGVPPDQCLAVEDSRQGVEAACRASMRCVAVPYLFDPPLDDTFLMADLLFAGGMASFTAEAAFSWLEPRLQR